ncbi:MAG: ABC transporter ATP-binding protein [Propionibacteriaceae bacterium]|nr:ABC transporter ATP-binding protein [Propionibacteriaceae bacterium]
MTSAVTIRGLRVRRGRVQVFDGLDLDIAAGRLTGLIGPSGCGKTTLIRSIVGLQIVQGGDVTVLGRPAGAPELRHRVTYSAQNDGLYRDLSVRDNVAYFAQIAGLPGSEVDRVIAAVGLAGQAKQRADSVSGGQFRRISLAIALLGRPDLILLDEPTVGLDPVLRADLWDMFARLARDGVTLIVSSHVMDEASRCDDLVLLREGQLVAATTPAGLLAETGLADADQAFLELIHRAEGVQP